MKLFTLLLCALTVGHFTVFSQAYQLDGELRKWHKITLTFDGPNTSETATPNPFTDYRLNVTFTNGSTTYVIPGYYAANGNAAETSSSSGNKWRVHFAPDKTGTWNFTVSFRQGTNVAVSDSPSAGQSTSFNGTSGSFNVASTNKTGRDHRGKGRLKYVNQHYLQYAETGEYFIKTGVDSPENFLAYDDFDNTPNFNNYRKSWSPHIQDWNPGDPTWKNGKGKGMIGALNYLADEGQNAFSSMTMNINGDDRNIFPYISSASSNRKRFDCSKLDQWEIVFEHADHLGLAIHLKTQEKENCRLLNDGNMGTERKVYYRELIARFGHHLAVIWNMGEESTNTAVQRRAYAQYFDDHDPYHHHLVIHPFPLDHVAITNQLITTPSKYTGVSLQSNWDYAHYIATRLVTNSTNSSRKWVVSNDEQGPSIVGVPPDGYTGDGQSQHDIRKGVLWGNLMAGGTGVEYYFGYSLAHSDLTCEDYRSRDKMWEYSRHAHRFFTTFVDVTDYANHDILVGNRYNNNSKYCLADPGKSYIIFLPNGGTTDLDLEGYNNTFQVKWYNPRNGGNLVNGTLATITGGGDVSIGMPPSSQSQDWVALVSLDGPNCPAAGTACNDGDPNTVNDVEDGNCNCAGTPPNCPVAGTACNDGDPNTVNDVEDGNCNCSGTVPQGGGTDVWLEAECADIGSNWSTISDANASNGSALLPPSRWNNPAPSGNSQDLVKFTFNVSTDGNYKVFGRVVITGSNSDSYWVRANGGPWVQWNSISFNDYGPQYQWEQVSDALNGNVLVTFALNAGTNTVEFSNREPNVKLDKLFVTLNGTAPTGIGVEADCDGGGCPAAGTACNDGDPNTVNDVEDGNCNCAGTPPNCPTAGTACNDNDPSTFNDVEDGNCNCEGTPCPTAGTACNDGNPNTVNDVEDGNCNCSGTVPQGGGTDVWLEAECADIGSNWSTISDANASNGSALLPPSRWNNPAPSGSSLDIVKFTFNVSTAGNYKVFGRVVITGSNSDSYWVRANGGNWVQWNSISFNDYGPQYQWEQVSDALNGNVLVTFALNAGTNTVEFSNREPNVKLDKLFVTLNGTAPTGIGVEADCDGGNGCPAAGTSCNDGDPSTFNDVEDGNCNCTGTPCPVAGTACNDGDPNTENDVEDGNCNCTGTPISGATVLWLEAECANVGSQWSIQSDNAASGGSYVQPPNQTSTGSAPSSAADLVTFNVNLSESGNYQVHARTMTTNGNDDSFWVRANGGAWQKWNKINADSYGPIYQWEQVGHWTGGNASTPVTFNLSAGTNTIQFAWREPNARLDKVVISKTAIAPQGSGETATNCGGQSRMTNTAELPDWQPGQDKQPFVEKATLLLYPNPATSELTIDWQQPLRQTGLLTITDINGKRILTTRLQLGDAKRSIPVDHLVPGVYLMTLHQDEATPIVQKFMVGK